MIRIIAKRPGKLPRYGLLSGHPEGLKAALCAKEVDQIYFDVKKADGNYARVCAVYDDEMVVKQLEYNCNVIQDILNSWPLFGNVLFIGVERGKLVDCPVTLEELKDSEKVLYEIV